MKQSSKCPKCGGDDIILDAKVFDSGQNHLKGELTVATFRKPDALIFKGRQETTVSAWVCAHCGYMELYANYPANLRSIG